MCHPFQMKALFLGFLLLTSAGMAVEGTVWYDASGEVAVVEGPAAEPLAEPFVPEWRQREIARRERQGSYRSSLYDDWRWQGDRSPYFQVYGGWYRGGHGCYRPIRRGGFYGSYRSTSGRFTATYRSGGGLRTAFLIR